VSQSAATAFQEEVYNNNFIDSIRAQATKRSYLHYLKKYREYCNGDIICNGDVKLIESKVKGFLLYQRQKDLSYNHIKCNLVAIMHFYTMNDIFLNRKKIAKYAYSDKKRPNKNIGYTSEQILTVLDFCDERLKAIIMIYASTGIRLAALPTLKLKDLTVVFLDDSSGGNDSLEHTRIYRITVYEGYKEEYSTFCTPECFQIIQTYLSYRERFGEELKPNSPLIREQFNPTDSFKVKHSRTIDIRTISKILRQKLIQAGIRVEDHVGIGDKTGGKMRKDVPLIHGFRKFFNTALMNADVAYTFKELLMGHSVKLDDVYYHKDSIKSKQKLLEEYSKAIDALTINEENRLRRQVEHLTVNKSQIQELKSQVDELTRLVKAP
jgi:integrase